MPLKYRSTLRRRPVDQLLPESLIAELVMYSGVDLALPPGFPAAIKPEPLAEVGRWWAAAEVESRIVLVP